MNLPINELTHRNFDRGEILMIADRTRRDRLFLAGEVLVIFDRLRSAARARVDWPLHSMQWREIA
jgi:hypothetical protein